jgi:hypothetical protein
MSRQEALEPLVRLRQAVVRALSDHGLAVEQLMVEAHEGAAMVHMLVTATEDDPTELRAALEETLRSTRDAELEHKSSVMLEDLKRRLRNGDAFL